VSIGIDHRVSRRVARGGHRGRRGTVERDEHAAVVAVLDVVVDFLGAGTQVRARSKDEVNLDRVTCALDRVLEVAAAALAPPPRELGRDLPPHAVKPYAPGCHGHLLEVGL